MTQKVKVQVLGVELGICSSWDMDQYYNFEPNSKFKEAFGDHVEVFVVDFTAGNFESWPNTGEEVLWTKSILDIMSQR